MKRADIQKGGFYVGGSMDRISSAEAMMARKMRSIDLNRRRWSSFPRRGQCGFPPSSNSAAASWKVSSRSLRSSAGRDWYSA